ncbi:MAG: hypothetical protein AAGB22_06625, partial [Bacteroidota bacterium]
PHCTTSDDSLNFLNFLEVNPFVEKTLIPTPLTMKKLVVFTGIVFLAFGTAVAQSTAPSKPATKPCTSEAHRQFDFWAGEWDVFNTSGKQVGTNHIQSILGGCVLEENWKGAGGSLGKSFNTYDPQSGLWKQVWVDNSGSTIHFAGSLVDGNMVLKGENVRNGKTVTYEMTYFPQEDGRVRQFWKASTDGGTTWKTLFDGMYVRKG